MMRLPRWNTAELMMHLPRWNTAELQAIALSVAVKTLVGLISVLVFQHFLSLGLEEQRAWSAAHHGTNPLSHSTHWFTPFGGWDGGHYLRLVEKGYAEGRDSRAFFPLYPMLIRLLSGLLPPIITGLLLNYIFSAGFCVFLYRLGVHYQCRQPHLVVLLTLSFPTAFYASMIYTEALFLFLLMGFVYHLLVTRSLAGLAYLALLPLTRGSAAFVFGALLLYALFDYARWWRLARQHANPPPPTGKRALRRDRRRRGVLRDAAPQKAPDPFRWRYYAACCVAFAIGCGAYLLFMFLTTGDPIIGVTGQQSEEFRQVGNRPSNVLNPLNYLNNLFMPARGWFIVPTIFDRIVMVAMLLGAVFLFARKEYALLCFYLPLIYAHGAMGIGHQAYARYALVAAPFLMIALAKHLKAPPLYAMCVLFFVVQAGLVYRISLGLWVG